MRDGVRIVVLVEPDGSVRAAFPAAGGAVVHNPDRARDPARPTVADLADGRAGQAAITLVTELAGRLTGPDARFARELVQVGEWSELGLLLAAAVPADALTAAHRSMLDDLR